MVLNVMAPFWCAVLLGVTAGLHSCCRSYLASVPWPAYTRTGVSLFLYSYTTIANTTFQYFNCISVGTHSVVASAPAVDCTSTEYRARSGLMFGLLLIFVIAAPFMILGLLRRAYLHGRLTTDDAFSQKFGVLYQTYVIVPWSNSALALGAYCWEVVAILRRSLMIALATIFYTSISPLHCAYALLCLGYFCAHLADRVKPYRRPVDNDLESLTLLFLCIHAIFLATFAPPPAFPLEVEAMIFFLLLLPVVLMAGIRVVSNVQILQRVESYFPTLPDYLGVKDLCSIHPAPTLVPLAPALLPPPSPPLLQQPPDQHSNHPLVVI